MAKNLKSGEEVMMVNCEEALTNNSKTGRMKIWRTTRKENDLWEKKMQG